MSVYSIPLTTLASIDDHCKGPTLAEHVFAYGDAVPFIPYTKSDVDGCISLKGVEVPSGPCVFVYAHYPSPNAHFIDVCKIQTPEKMVDDLGVIGAVATVSQNQAFAVAIYGAEWNGDSHTHTENPSIDPAHVSPVPLPAGLGFMLIGLLMLGRFRK